jgi:low temperature requirement protein LtrA
MTSSLPARDLGSPETERGWLELFYDLVFVAAILILSHSFSHAHDGGDGLWFTGTFVAIWWIWLSMTLHANRYPDDHLGYRLVALAQMFLVALVAISASDGPDVQPRFVTIAYACLTISVALMYARAPGPGPRGSFARGRITEYVAATVIFAVAAAVPEPLRVALWVAGLGVMILPAIAHCTKYPPLNEEHLLERFAALTIIMLGEAFVKVALAADTDGFDHIDVLAVGLEFIVVFAIWSCYFDDVPEARIWASARRRATWIGAHLLLHLGIVGVAIGVARFVTFRDGQDVPTWDVAAVAIPLAGVYLGLIVISVASRRRPLRRIVELRIGAMVAVGIIVGVAEWATWFDTSWSVACFAAVAVSHAVLENRARADTRVLAESGGPNGQVRR